MIRFGICPTTSSPPNGENLDRLWDEIVEEAQVAEEAGFDIFAFTEHHQQEDGYFPSPLTAAAAIAGVTSRIKVGSTVLLLPLYHPVRVAEDAALLDIMSKGRLYLAVGAGYAPDDYGAFNIPPSHRPTLFEEGLEILTRAWTEDEFTHLGRRYTLRNVRVRPRPLQKPRPPIYAAAWSHPGAVRAARMSDGWHCDLVNKISTLQMWARTYHEQCRRLGKKGHVSVLRDGYCAATTETAAGIYGPHVVDAHKFYFKYGGYDPKVEPFMAQVKHADDLRLEHIQEDRFILGSPDDCIQQIERYIEELGASEFIIRMRQVSGPSHAEMLESIRLFGREVIPHFRKKYGGV